MDRRDFLKVGGAAAVTAGGAGTATAQSAPVILANATELRLASPGSPDVPGFGPDRLARRIELATGGRYRIVAEADAAAADLLFGDVNRQREWHPAFAVFAGLPLDQGLDSHAHQTWLAVGGGQMLWDDLAAQFGFKPLVAGHTGPSSGLWAARRLESVSDLAGARLHVAGLAADVVRALGATPVNVALHDLRIALAEGHLDGAELLGPLALAAPDLQPLAERLYSPGLNAGGHVVSLDVRTETWDRLGASDQVVFEACAAEAYQLALVEARGHEMMAAQIATTSKWPVRSTLGREVSAALKQTTDAILADMAGRDRDAQRIQESYRAFSAMLDAVPAV